MMQATKQAIAKV